MKSHFFIFVVGIGIITMVGFNFFQKKDSSSTVRIAPSPTFSPPSIPSTAPTATENHLTSQASCVTTEFKDKFPDGLIYNVKNCSDNPICDKMGSFEARFCRLPNGTCSFFCTDK